MKFVALAAALAAIAPSVTAAPKAAPQEASVPFVNHGTLDDYRADGDSAVYLRANLRWYHATLLGPCVELPSAQVIGIETRGIDTLDKYSSLIVRGQRCQLQSLVASGPPPRKPKKQF